MGRHRGEGWPEQPPALVKRCSPRRLCKALVAATGVKLADSQGQPLSSSQVQPFTFPPPNLITVAQGACRRKLQRSGTIQRQLRCWCQGSLEC